MVERRSDASTMLAVMLPAYSFETDDFLERYAVTMGLTSRSESKHNGNWSLTNQCTQKSQPRTASVAAFHDYHDDDDDDDNDDNDDDDDDNNNNNNNNNCTDVGIKSPTIHLRLNTLELWNRKSSRPCADVTIIVLLILELAVLFKCSCRLCSYDVFMSSCIR